MEHYAIYKAFRAWAADLAKKNGMKFILVALEPTGHYWMNLGTYIKDSRMILAQVNPAAVKKSKELDDNDPSKNDRKDPKVIAGLACDGRYCLPYIPLKAFMRKSESCLIREHVQWKN